MKMKKMAVWRWINTVIGTAAVLLSASVLMGPACDDVPRAERRAKPKASSGAVRQTVKVKTDAQGRTVEQRNVGRRLTMDNEPGSIKHLYIVSTQSGQTLLYSTVKGKVTSGGKRLAPKTVAAGYLTVRDGQYSQRVSGYGPEVQIGNKVFRSSEVMGDDGTYGSSGEYLYWWDEQDQYYQVYVTGGMMPLVSSRPLRVQDVIMNLEITDVTKRPTANQTAK